MSSEEFPHEQPRDLGRRDGAARSVARGVAERERGRRRLNATTATVSFASVVAAGAVAVTLPGSAHTPVSSTSHSSTSHSSTSSSSAKSSKSSKSSSSPSSAKSSSNTGSSNSSNSSNSSTLQAPTSAPVQSSGGGQATSGGTSGW